MCLSKPDTFHYCFVATRQYANLSKSSTTGFHRGTLLLQQLIKFKLGTAGNAVLSLTDRFNNVSDDLQQITPTDCRKRTPGTLQKECIVKISSRTVTPPFCGRSICNGRYRFHLYNTATADSR